MPPAAAGTQAPQHPDRFPAHSFDSAVEHVPDSESESSGSDSDQPATAGESLVAYMHDLYLERKITATDFCTLAHHAKNAGVAEAAKYACNPSADTGKFQKHLNKTLPYLQKDNLDLLYIFGCALP